jgi:hypothetical protein
MVISELAKKRMWEIDRRIVGIFRAFAVIAGVLMAIGTYRVSKMWVIVEVDRLLLMRQPLTAVCRHTLI